MDDAAVAVGTAARRDLMVTSDPRGIVRLATANGLRNKTETI